MTEGVQDSSARRQYSAERDAGQNRDTDKARIPQEKGLLRRIQESEYRTEKIKSSDYVV
jgi:hypothetical protein